MTSPDPEQAANFLEAALLGGEELLDQATVDLSVELPLIDGYKLLRLIGEGGFGMVYEAEQRVPIRRRVALKVLRPGSTTRELLARFEQERQMLALLNHPHIARIYDAGETEDGRPFIAMELVIGPTIDRHAAKLGLREKIGLMRDVCRAVGHAHRKGIIHRDLKPSNILITKPDDGSPEPRVIDFGVAKALDGPLSAKVMFTQIRQIVGTPGYMSPERQHTSQISHSADTRTDVFALGAILWELLTGKTPEQTPDGANTRVTLPNAAQLPAELRWIAAKATDADMEQRYANADGLADDLAAWLGGHPLTAAPHSTFYVLRKWANRHRVAAASIACMLVTLITALILTWHNHQRMSIALAAAQSSRQEMLRAVSNADYLMGITREQDRPVHAMAHWARSLRHDPQNIAASGMLLSALRHRSYPRAIAPSVALPEGAPNHLAVSSDGKIAALVLGRNDAEWLVCARQGQVQPLVCPIPADGRMTLLAVSSQQRVAVCGSSGRVGLLQPDGTWLESERSVNHPLGLVWNSQGHLWIIGAGEIVLCDESGNFVRPAHAFTGRVQRWAATEIGDKIAVGIGRGSIWQFDAATETPQEIHPPQTAPFSALSVNDQGDIAAAWRNDEIWVHSKVNTARSFRVPDVLEIEFLPDSSTLMVRNPTTISFWSAPDETPAFTHEPTQSLLSARPMSDGRVLMQNTAGRARLHDFTTGKTLDIPGVTGRESYALADRGRSVVMADPVEHVLEWLQPSTTPVMPVSHSSTHAWLAMTPTERLGAWHAVDTQGWVCATGSAGTVRTLWRVEAKQLRIAAVNVDGNRVIFDDESGPGLLCSRQGEATVRRHWGKASAVALSADGRTAALGYPAGHVTLWDMESGAEIATRLWNSGVVTALTFVDDQRIAVASASQMRVWEWLSGKALPNMLDFSGNITALAADRGGHQIALATNNGSLHVLHIESGLRMCCELPTSKTTTCLLWDESDHSLWSFSRDSLIQQAAMPPPLDVVPAWLPDYAEHRIGMKVNELGRVTRLHSQQLPNPLDKEDTAPALKAWLEQ